MTIRCLLFLIISIFSVVGFCYDCTRGVGQLNTDPNDRYRIAVFADALHYSGPIFKDLTYEPFPEMETLRFHSKKGRVPPDAKALVIALHGQGGEYSHSGAMLYVLNVLNASRTNKSKGIVAGIQKNPHWMPLGAESFDQPFHGYGSRDEKYRNLDEVLKGFVAEVSSLKALAPHMPIIILGRSGSTGVTMELVNKYPGLVDGIVLMAPMHPDPEKGFRKSGEVFMEMAAGKHGASEARVNMAGYNWISGLYPQMTWHHEENPLKVMPSLVLAGQNDIETFEETKKEYTDLVGRSGRGQLMIIPNQKHDVFNAYNEAEAIQSFNAVYDFIASIVEQKSSQAQ